MGRFNNLDLGSGVGPLPATGRVPRPAPPLLVPDRPDPLAELRLASAAFDEGDFQEAVRGFSRVISAEPVCAAAWVGQVRAMLEVGMGDEVLACCDRGLRQLPGHGDLLGCRALAHLRRNQRSRARIDGEAGIAAATAGASAWLAWGEVALVLDRRGDEDAFATAESRQRVEDSAPERVAGLQLAVARAYLRHRHAALAHDWAKRSVQTRAANGFAWTVLGTIREQLGLAEEAAAAYRQAVAIDARQHAAVAGIRRLEDRDPLRRVWDAIRRIFRR